MGIFSKLFGGKVETRGQVLDVLGGIVGPHAAENLATIAACVGAISSGLASLPILVYARSTTSRREAATHPVASVLRDAGPDFIETLMSSTCLHGNGIAVIGYDAASRPASLTPIPWNQCRVSMLPSGTLAYDVTPASYPYGPVGAPKRYLQEDIIHLRDRSDDGLIGRSRISRSAEVIGNAIALQEFASAAWRNQGTPSGAVEIEASLNETQYRRLSEQVDSSVRGVANARKVLILDNKTTWKSISISPEDAEVLASRRFTVEELCRLYQVPPPLVQSYEFNTFTNSAAAGRWFAQFCLASWARKLEAELGRKLLSSGYEIEIDLSGLLRGDPETRWASNVAAVNAGILSVNEIREAEGYGPVPGGELPQRQASPIPAGLGSAPEAGAGGVHRDEGAAGSLLNGAGGRA